MCALFSGGQDLRLLRIELGVGEDPLRLEVGEILELCHLIPGRRRGRRGRCCRVLRLLLGVLLVLLLGPAVLLAARDAVGYSCGRAGDGSGTRDTSEKRHVSLLSASGRVERGPRGRPGGCNRRPRAVRHRVVAPERSSSPTGSRRSRWRQRSRGDDRRRVVEVLLADQARRDALEHGEIDRPVMVQIRQSDDPQGAVLALGDEDEIQDPDDAPVDEIDQYGQALAPSSCSPGTQPPSS